jgi:transcriptional regulator with XRE-family HTH domain
VGKRMFPNLRAEITRHNLTMAEVADAIGLTATHFSLKMNGKYGFTLSEAFAIKQFLKTKLSIDELFMEALDEAV